MRKEDFDKLCVELDKLSTDTMDKKRPAYTVGSSNVLENFDSIGKKLGIHPGLVALVYFTKHMDAIANHFKDKYEDPEPIDSRFVDALSYIKLMYAIAKREDPSINSPF